MIQIENQKRFHVTCYSCKSELSYQKSDKINKVSHEGIGEPHCYDVITCPVCHKDVGVS